MVYEAASSIAVYSRDTTTELLTFANTAYSLLPSGFSDATRAYSANEVLSSEPASNPNSPVDLITATRSLISTSTGYVSAFSLNSVSGAIAEQLILLPTPASGVSANAASPALFNEDYVAITDSGGNYFEMWRIVASGNGTTTASAVARLDFDGNAANIVWYI